MVQKQRPPRGRPRLYDPDVALARAMDVFWDRGFAATSLDDLGEAMGMNRPSVYAAFGDKHELFVKTLRRYQEAGQDGLRRALAPQRPLRESLRDLFSMLLARYLSGEQVPRGCFMFTVAITEAVQDPAVRAVVADAMRAFDAAFEARFEIARHQGEIAPTADPVALARLASGLVHTLSVRARAGEKRPTLQTVIDAFLIALCGPDANGRRSTRGGGAPPRVRGARKKPERL
jgi:AcrR family transcriptional regulator